MTLKYETIDHTNDAFLEILEVLHKAIFTPEGEAPWSAENFKNLLDNPVCDCWLFYSGYDPVGLILFTSIVGEIEIITLGVSPTCQGEGLATEMLSQLMKFSKGSSIDNIHLEVRADNAAAIKLYKNAGFHIIGDRPNYYKLANKSMVDALLFTFSFCK